MEGKKKGAKKRSKKGKSIKKVSNEEIFKALEVKVGLTNKEITNSHEAFMNTCSTGEMTKAQFLEASKSTLGDEGGLMADSLFRVFDEDSSGTMDFTEYMMASNCTSLKEPKEKLTWIFNVFDEDCGGSIDIDEVIKLVIGLFNMGGIEAEKEVLLACVQDILEAVDVDNDGDITKEEFVDNAMKSHFIRNLLDGN